MCGTFVTLYSYHYGLLGFCSLLLVPSSGQAVQNWSITRRLGKHALTVGSHFHPCLFAAGCLLCDFCSACYTMISVPHVNSPAIFVAQKFVTHSGHTLKLWVAINKCTFILLYSCGILLPRIKVCPDVAVLKNRVVITMSALLLPLATPASRIHSDNVSWGAIMASFLPDHLLDLVWRLGWQVLPTHGKLEW